MTETATMTPVPLAGADRASQPFQRSLIVDGALETIAASLRSAIEAAGMWVIYEINPQALLARDGYESPAARQILFFHPSLMARLFVADSAALTEAPLKFALTQASGDRVMIRWSDPMTNFARYGDPALKQLGRDLADLTDQIAQRLVNR